MFNNNNNLYNWSKAFSSPEMEISETDFNSSELEKKTWDDEAEAEEEASVEDELHRLFDSETPLLPKAPPLEASQSLVEVSPEWTVPVESEPSTEASKQSNDGVCAACGCSCRSKPKSDTAAVVSLPVKMLPSPRTTKIVGHLGNEISYGSASGIVSYDGVELTSKNINAMSLEQKHVVSEALFEYFREGGFPYPKYDVKELRQDWVNLCTADSKQVLANSMHQHLSNKVLYGNKIFRHFHGENFFSVKGPSKSDRSMLEAFESDKILKQVLDNRLGITYKERFNMHGAMLRQGFRSTRSCFVSSIFNSMIAKHIYEKYLQGESIVFDYSMGFGQRMLGALASNKNAFYVACDPWKEVVDTNREVAEFFGKSNHIDLINVGSENFPVEKYKGYVSLAFSSPPYFTKEIYDNNNPTQASYNKSYDEFINIWWRKTVENIEELLIKDGHLILNMVESNAKENQKLLKDMIDVCMQHGFVVTEKLFIQLSKSHFSPNKKENPNKLEPIVVMKKKS